MLPRIVGPDFKPFWKPNLTIDEYHADKSAISSTPLRKALISPRAFLDYYQGNFVGDTPSFRFGRAFGMAAAEPKLFSDTYVVEPKFSGEGSMKARKEFKAAFPESLKQDEFDDLKRMIESVSSHKDAGPLLRDGKNEISGYFADPDTGILCRFRPDCFHPGHMAVLDVKTTTCIEEREFINSALRFGYHVQLAFYCDGVEAITGKKVKYPFLLAVEKSAPFDCAVYRLNDDFIELGRITYKKALKVIKEGMDTGKWSRYQDRFQEVAPPAWLTKGN